MYFQVSVVMAFMIERFLARWTRKGLWSLAGVPQSRIEVVLPQGPFQMHADDPRPGSLDPESSDDLMCMEIETRNL